MTFTITVDAPPELAEAVEEELNYSLATVFSESNPRWPKGLEIGAEVERA